MPYFHATLRIWRALAFQRQHAKFYSRSHDAVIRVYDEAGNVIETHEQVPEELANYLDPIAKHLAEEVDEISDYLRAELLNE